jgi:heat shock protein HspQ
MEIVITQWALDSYLDLKGRKVFSDEEFKNFIRPDVLRLRDLAIDPKFANNKFWSQAQDLSGRKIQNGFKMKWHQIGSGRIQLRLTVAIIDGIAYLCEAYVKHTTNDDKRRQAKFKVYIELIRRGHYTVRGKLI